MVKIRLVLQGSKKKPFYKIVVADSRFPRNGRFIEQIGFFNPNTKDQTKKIHFNVNRIQYWIKNGAKLSDRTKYLIKQNNLIEK
ncbi:30S ribosomal protein S16 [Buchnera aphidicola]|uniref:30S ribosomal protein S16 n=1 Tax=Buchnera aphidicola TaxID=9 RepID=UPI003464D6C5